MATVDNTAGKAGRRPSREAADRARALFVTGFVMSDSEESSSSSSSDLDTDDILDEFDPEPGPSNNTAVTGAGGGDGDQARDVTFKSYDDVDNDINHTKMEFKPSRRPGLQTEKIATRSNVRLFNSPLDFFRLFFTTSLIQILCDSTNVYAWLHILDKTSYSNPDGSWTEVTPEEMWKFIALIIYMGFIKVPTIKRYWSTASLYHGLWARHFMARDRFIRLLGMLHISDPSHPNPNDKLHKVRLLLDHMKTKCQELYQPEQNISVDERMVKSKGRSGIRQYIKNKPVKFGLKLWVLAESKTGYTSNFDVYTGKRETPSEHGLSFDVVIKLCEFLQHQGYRVYFDNFYTSPALLQKLLELGFLACGTCTENRRAFPVALKEKTWMRRATRGNMRYVRDGPILCLQWRDNKIVTMLSTAHAANDYTWVRRRVKQEGEWRQKLVRKPCVIEEYNHAMGGVDKSDQYIANYNVLIKSVRWWKVLFFHMIDVAIVNSWILFQSWQKQYPDVQELHRPSDYSQLNFREELVRQLADIHESGPSTTPALVPQYRPEANFKVDSCFDCEHMIVYSPSRHNCSVCYITKKIERKVHFSCAAASCKQHGAFFCVNKDKNCFEKWHSADFNNRRSGRVRKNEV